MMAQDWAESTWVPISYGSLIKQFLLNTIKFNAVTQKYIYKNVYII